MDTVFSEDYRTCRSRFRQAAEQAGLSLESYPIAEQGPDGEPLSIDCALGGDTSAERTLILSSGLHGVEGFFGSAVQLDTIRRFTDRQVSGIRWVFMHGLNPYGFAWIRRFDQNNIDPNRNFMLDGEVRKGAPKGYPALDPLLNPKRPPSRLDPFRLKAFWPILRHGLPALRQTIAAGQYEYPTGLFFGGLHPVDALPVLTGHIDRWVGDSPLIGHLDFHTGLGKSADHRLLIEFSPTDAQKKLLHDWYGEESFETGTAPEIAYQTRGGFGHWCVNRFADRNYLFGCAEFGTYSSVSVLSALRTENQAFHWESPSPTTDHWSKRRLKERFCPASPEWREKVISGARTLVDQTISGLRDTTPHSPITA